MDLVWQDGVSIEVAHGLHAVHLDIGVRFENNKRKKKRKRRKGEGGERGKKGLPCRRVQVRTIPLLSSMAAPMSPIRTSMPASPLTS